MIQMKEESPEQLEGLTDDSKEPLRILEENHRQMRELLERATELVAEMREARACREQPC